MNAELGDGLTDWESISTIIRNFGLVAAALIALPLAVWRSVVAGRQADAAQRQAETAQRSLLNERYQKGAEMLGSADLAVRLGGVYALARLAREHSEDYHPQVLRLFCAYVRKPSELNANSGKLHEDVQEIITAVCARSEEQIETEKREYCPLDLSGADLQGVDLLSATFRKLFSFEKTTGANLEHAIMADTNLEDASLTSANLKDANLCGANLTGSLLINTNLSRTDLRKCKGLTQDQLDQAIVDPDTTPILEGVVDAVTNKPLVWRA